MVCLIRLYSFKFFKGCLPQILLGPFSNTLFHFSIVIYHLSESMGRIPWRIIAVFNKSMIIDIIFFIFDRIGYYIYFNTLQYIMRSILGITLQHIILLGILSCTFLFSVCLFQTFYPYCFLYSFSLCLSFLKLSTVFN